MLFFLKLNVNKKLQESKTNLYIIVLLAKENDFKF